MDHDTKPTHYEPPGFGPTPMKPGAGCLSTMVLQRCGYFLCTPSPSVPQVVTKGMFGVSRPSLGFEPPTQESTFGALPPYYPILCLKGGGGGGPSPFPGFTDIHSKVQP